MKVHKSIAVCCLVVTCIINLPFVHAQDATPEKSPPAAPPGTATVTVTAAPEPDGKNVDYTKLYTTEQPKPQITVKLPDVDHAKIAEDLNKKKVKAAEAMRKMFLASGGFLGFLNWLLLLVNVFVTIYVLGNVSKHIGKNRVLPKSLIDEVRDFLARGELGFAIESCKNSHAPLARILFEAFKYIGDGFEAGQDAMKNAINSEEIKLWKPVKSLIPCAIISLALGFTGMSFVLIKQLKAYASSSSIAAEKILAYSTAQSFYPLIIGIVGACIAFLLYVYSVRKITRIIVNTKLLSYDIIRVLRGAEVLEEEFPEMATMTQLINSDDYR